MNQSGFSPTPKGIQAAQKATFADPATLARLMQYALNHLEDDLKAHPEDAPAIEAEGMKIQAFRLRVLAALREESESSMATDDAWAANMWMLSADAHDAEEGQPPA